MTRTERDLATALTALERYAPDPADVLRTLRTRPDRPARWLRRRPLVLAAGTVAGGAVLAVALLPGAGARPAPPGLPDSSSVAQAMLTAFDTVSGDVEYETQTGSVHGTVTDIYRSWSWPAQPAPGQRLLIRERDSGRSPASPAVKLVEDFVVSLVTPPAGRVSARGQIMMVCFLGSGQTGCGYQQHETQPGTWSRFTAQVSLSTDVGVDGGFNPATLARGIAQGVWRVVGRTQLDGHQAIELRSTGRSIDHRQPLQGLLWIDAHTYLPIRMVTGTASTGMGVLEFRFLPPTAASLALLRVPIPPGYPQR
jgi:hypothetical protein